MSAVADVPRPPAGWRQTMRAVPGLPFVMLTVAAHMTIFGMLTPVMAIYARSFAVDEWQIGLMITVFAVGRLMADIPSGYGAQRIGLGPLLCAGPALMAMGSLIGALAESYGLLLAGRTLQGVGSGIYMTAATVFCARASDRRSRGKVMALFQGAMLTGAAAGPVLGGLAATAFGHTGPFHAAAGIGAATTVFAVVLWRAGAVGAGTGAARVIATRPDETGPDAAGQPHAVAALLIAPFLCVLLINFAVFLTRTAAQWQMIPLLAVDRHGLGPDAIGLAITLSALANLAVLPAAGWLVDAVSRPAVIVISVLATAVSLMVIVVVDHPAALYAAMIGMGVSTGIGGPAVAAFAVDVVPEHGHGPAMGLMRFTGDLGYLVGPLTLGLMVDYAIVGHAGAIAVNAAMLAVFGAIFALFATGRRPARAAPSNRRRE